MGKVFKYDPKRHTTIGYPTRKDLFADQDEIDPNDDSQVLFHPIDMTSAYSRMIYDEHVKGYTLIISGVLENGTRAQIIISEIPLYFDIKITSADSKIEIREIKEMLDGNHDKLEIVKAYPGIGFNEDMSTYLRVYFSNIFNRRKSVMMFQEKGFGTASDVDMFGMPNEIVNRNEWTLGDWCLVSNYRAKWVEKYQTWAIYITNCDDYVAVNRPLACEEAKCKTKPPLYLKLGYDIEVNSMSFALPTPMNIKETVFMLCFGIYRSDQHEPVYTATITDQEYMKDVYLEKSPDWDLILCKNDGDVILAFGDILKRFYPEFRLAFNSFGFDDPYICERINQNHYKKFELFANMALPMPYSHIFPEKRKMIDTLFIETRVKLDGAFDMNASRKRLHLPGTINIDMMIALKKMNPKDDMLASHGLRAYLERYNLPNKLDISFQDMNKAYNEELPELMYETALYCVVDSISCVRLEQKVALIDSYKATAHLALCSISDAFIRAGGMKVKNVIYCIGRRMQCNYTEKPKKSDYSAKFPGAVVFSPVKGFYQEVPTIVLDFSSLYPSVIRALWISSETYLDDKAKAKELKEKGYDVFKFHLNWDYKETIGEEGDKEVIDKTVDKDVFYVRQTPDGDKCRGVFPVCLEFLINTRKIYKKKMGAASRRIAQLQKCEHDPNDMKEAIIEERDYNGKQIATKIVANTLYGAIGAKIFTLYNVYLASTITLFARKSIIAASDIATDRGYKRIYGDSFTGNTPLILRIDGEIIISRVDELIPDDCWEDREDGKQYFDTDNTEVWEVGKFVKVNQLIRHRVNKPIIRVCTHGGLVDVTPDHSLYKADGTKISPNDVIVTSGVKRDGTYSEGTHLLSTEFDNLMHQFNKSEETEEITEDLAWCYGIFASEGHSGKHMIRYKRKDKTYGHYYTYDWTVVNSDMDIINKYREKCGFVTKLYLTRDPEKYNDTLPIYAIHHSGKGKKDLSLKYRSMFYNDHNEKIIPMEILNSKPNVCRAFLDGFFDGDGCKPKGNKQYKAIEHKGQQALLGLYLIAKKCGHTKLTINCRENRDWNLYILTYNLARLYKPLDVVKKKYTLHEEYNDYVYDLNTETGKHHAGVGNLVISNTDSVFLEPKREQFEGLVKPREKVTHCQGLAEDLLVDIRKEIRRITRRDTDVINMELDKMLFPALYTGKKKYYGLIWEDAKEPMEYISGLEFKKRGKSQLLRDLSQRIVTESMSFDFKQDMLEFVTQVLSDGVDELKSKPIEYFVKQAKYRPGKAGSANMFIARMKEKEKIDPVLYQVPDPGTPFEYILTGVIDQFMSNGNKRAMKKTDQWEFRHVVERLKLKPDYIYYLDDVIGSLARFINYYDQFQPERGGDGSVDDTIHMDDDEADKKSQKNAEKYLREKLAEFNHMTSLNHTVIKRQRKFLNLLMVKTYSGLIDHLIDAFDNNIDVDGLIQYILNSTKRNRFPIQATVSKHLVEKQIKDDTKYIVQHASLLEGLYEEYMGRLDDMSRQEQDLIDIGMKFKGNNPMDIIDTINRLIKNHSILASAKDGGDPIEDALSLVFD